MGTRARPVIRTVIFDLDDTLYDCYRQRIPVAHRHACRAMLRAGLRRAKGRQPSVESLYRLRRRLLARDPGIETIDARICRVFQLERALANRVARAGFTAYFSSPVGRLHLFPDALPVLRRIHDAGVRIYIVTAGQRSIQNAKLRRLGLEKSPLIRRTFITGVMDGAGKKDRFRAIVPSRIDRKQTLVIGDRVDREIRAAKRLGMVTVRKLGGEFSRHRPRSSAEKPDFTIRRLSELLRLPLRFGE